ncbi:MAG: oligosaccharide flippase family protein [Christensenellaceae bacterium]
MNKIIRNDVLKGAFYLGTAMFIAKVIGAFYRIPLTNIIGAKNIGIYQMVFPLYTMLLTLSSSGIPLGLTKLIAGGLNAEKVLKTSLKYFSLLGAIGWALMSALSPALSALQRSKEVVPCYITLAPSVFLVSLISCFRGYFQGKSNMLPTAVSNVTEQLVKTVFGLSLCIVLSKYVLNPAVLLTVSVTVSELVTVILLYVLYKKSVKLSISPPNNGSEIKFSLIFFTVFPLMLSSLILPLSRMTDSFVVLRWLPAGVEQNITDFGLYSGAVESLIGVPVALLNALVISAMPKISGRNGGKKAVYVLFSTLIVSVAISVITALFAEVICRLIYGGLSSENRSVLKSLLSLSAPQIALLSLLQAESAILTAKSRQKILPFNLAVGVAVKFIAMYILVKNPDFGVFGLAISDSLCYFVACSLDLLYIIGISRRSKSISNKFEIGGKKLCN